MVTSTRSRMRPPEISATSASLIVPIEASAFGSFQAWLKILVRAYFPARSAGVRPSRWLIASSLIGGCVPSAIKTSNAVAPASVVSSCSTRNIRSMGAVRVWSGTIASTRLPAKAPLGDLLAAERAHGRFVELGPFRAPSGHLQALRQTPE